MNKNIINRIRVAAFVLFPLMVVLSQQGCGQVKFSGVGNILTGAEQSSSPGTQPVDSSASSNGGTYGGRLRILHHYVDNFSCEGRPQPESILILNGETQWVIIQNTASHCAEIDQAPVADVIYDDVAKVATYAGKTYLPPKTYVVDPNEDPNLPDIKPIDGVCEDENFKCSLAAAMTNAGLAQSTANVEVDVPQGHYLLTSKLTLNTANNANTISLKGSTSILDGGAYSNILAINGGGNSVSIDNFVFQNGINSSWSDASAISLDFFGTLQITNSQFVSNSGGNIIYGGQIGSLKISNTQFSNNNINQAGIYLRNSSGSLFDQISMTNQPGGGTGITSDGDSGFQITRSYLSGISGTALYLGLCDGCSIENTTIANNTGDGILAFQNQNYSSVFNMNNVTIYNNGSSSAHNLYIFSTTSTAMLVVTNSIIAGSGATVQNCALVGATTNATYNLFSDTSCGNGATNIIGNPLLSAPAYNGGPTITMMPLPSSPVIDAGENSTCAAVDQRGDPRPIDKLGNGALCDIGAVEVQ